MPVPPGFTLGTRVHERFVTEGKLPDLRPELKAAMRRLELATGFIFGDPDRPLCVAVRSGAVVATPGLRDTILDVGLNPDSVRGLAERFGDAAFAWDCYRRFIVGYGRIVLKVGEQGEDPLGSLIDDVCFEAEVNRPRDLPAEMLEDLCERLQGEVRRYSGKEVPQDCWAQLYGALFGVLGAWQKERPRAYRSTRAIDSSLGTAVTVQAMVYGNVDARSYAGVALSRDPSLEDSGLFGEYLQTAQGEDVSYGRATPLPLSSGDSPQTFERQAPECFEELTRIADELEVQFGDIIELEFTVQQGALYILRCRLAPRGPRDALRSAVRMVEEGKLTPGQALSMVSAEELEQVLQRSQQHEVTEQLLTTGLPASPGVATGALVFDAAEAAERGWRDEAVILLQNHTGPEDIPGIERCTGLLTTRGGLTCHAAVVARGLNKPCVVNAAEIRLDREHGRAFVGELELKAGAQLSVDGRTGQVTLGQGVPSSATLPPEVETLIAWADARRCLKVRSNAEELADVRCAREAGAEGLGMLATDGWLTRPPARALFQSLALAGSAAARQAARGRLLQLHRDDFSTILEEAGPMPVAVRLFDASLSEVLPSDPKDLLEVAEVSGRSMASLEARIAELKGFNPRFGLRGVRLGVVRPEIYRMQLQALFEAMAARAEDGLSPEVEVLLPMVSMGREVDAFLGPLHTIAKRVQREREVELRYKVGVVIEVPRTALLAGRLAKRVDLLLFGMNDLTQCCYGMSREDATAFLPAYREAGILSESPFTVLDERGLGELLRIACERARAARADLQIGVSGAQVEDPGSVAFFDQLGMDFVSCAPLRVPIAKLVAAQAMRRTSGVERREVGGQPSSAASLLDSNVRLIQLNARWVAFLALGLTACAQDVPGESPPIDRLQYPMGLVASADGEALFVLSSNFDQLYNAGQLHSLSVERLFALTAASSTTSFTFSESFSEAVNGRVRVDSLSGELAYVDSGAGGYLYTASRTTERLTMIQADASGALSCDRFGTSVGYTDCTDSNVIDTAFPDALAVAAAPFGADDRIIMTMDSTAPLTDDPGLELIAFSQSRLLSRSEGEDSASIALYDTEEDYYGGMTIAALPTSSSTVARFLLAERYNYGDPRMLVATLTSTGTEASASGLSISFGDSLNLGDLASAIEVRGIAIDADRDRAFVTVRYAEAMDATNSGVLVFDISDPDAPVLRSALEVGDAIGRPTLEISEGRRLLYLPDLRENRIYVVDAQSDQLAVVAEMNGYRQRSVDGKEIWANTLSTPVHIAFAERGGRKLGFVTNFGNSTLAIFDASDADPRRHQLIARFGKAVNAEGEEEGE